MFHDREGIYVMLRCARRKSSAEAVPREILRVEARELGIFLDDECYGFIGKLCVTQFHIGFERTEYRPCGDARGIKPVLCSTYGANSIVGCLGNRDFTAFSKLVAFGAWHEYDHTLFGECKLIILYPC